MNWISTILLHPNQEDKSGKAVYASIRKVNSSTNNIREDNVNMPRGADTDYEDELPETKKRNKSRLFRKNPKQ